MFIGNDAIIEHAKYDAKEFDPKYMNTIKDVEDRVHAEMKRNGTFGQFGSVHTFWELKQEYLKAKDIIWHSPEELNPNTRYD